MMSLLPAHAYPPPWLLSWHRGKGSAEMCLGWRGQGKESFAWRSRSFGLPSRHGAEIPTVGASSGSSPGHMGPAEDGVGQAELPSKAEVRGMGRWHSEPCAGDPAQEEDPDSENEKLMVREPEDEDEDAADETFSFKYSPGKLRGNQYKSMMTKEELEEEQRVQREQLAAIFRLMKEKSDTFGEMSEGDMKEQLRLYDI
nr:matrix-remodeling-associated protein 7 isoform X2 [Columba livia]